MMPMAMWRPATPARWLSPAAIPSRAAVELHVHGERCGQAQFTVTLDTAGTQSITATERRTSSITGTESGIVVQAAAAKTLAITGFPTTDTAGTAGNVDGNGLRRLWQRGDWLYRHGGSLQQRPAGRAARELHVHREPTRVRIASRSRSRPPARSRSR